MAGKHRGNFNIFGHYTYFVPNVPELVILLVWFIVGALAGNAVSLIFSVALGAEAAMEYGTVVAYPIMFIPPMMYASIKSQRNSFSREGIKLDGGNFAPLGGASCALLVAVGTITLAYCADAVTTLLPEMPEWLKKMLESMTSGNFFVNLLCVSIFAPLFEEWLCRGMVLRGLLGNGVKPVWAIVISAVFFALIHMNLWQAVPAFLLGCLFGYVYFKTGSLKLTMLMHFVNNTIALVMSQIPSLKEFENWRDLFDGPEYYIIMGCCAVATVLVILALKRIPLKTVSGNLEKVTPLFEE